MIAALGKKTGDGKTNRGQNPEQDRQHGAL
jgi:hypothetical protein